MGILAASPGYINKSDWIAAWFVIDFPKVISEEAILVIDLQSGNVGWRKSFAYKEGFKWSLCNTVRRFTINNKHQLEAFSNWDNKILAENLKFWGKCKNVPKTSLSALLEMELVKIPKPDCYQIWQQVTYLLIDFSVFILGI